MTQRLDGLIIKAQSGFFTVRTEAGDYVCQIPGRLKKERQETDLAAAGDRVTISVLTADTGMIEAIAPRQRVLSRARPSGRNVRDSLSDREQVLLANPDQVVLVFSIRQPAPSLRKLDRFLVVAERNDLPAIICVTKTDLVQPDVAAGLFQLYADIGYTVLYTSIKTGAGLAALHDILAGKISVLTGSSGVGKTSLLNALQPGLGLQVRAVSRATEKGMHTTWYVELTPFAGGYVADTPGIRSITVWDVEPEEVDGYFREIAPLVPQCRFTDCTHRAEPGCAVSAAVEAGTISRTRYQSYLSLRDELEQAYALE